MIRWSGGRQKYTFVAGREGFKNLIIVKQFGFWIANQNILRLPDELNHESCRR